MTGGAPDAGFAVLRVTPETAGLLDWVAPEVFDARIDPERLAAYLASPLNALFVAVSGGTVVGQARGTILLQPDTPSELYIDNLGVTPLHRRGGMGRALIAALMDWGRQQGCAECWVGTEPDNIPARRLYEGFEGEAAETFVLYFYDL